jgi:hypothetical protein
MTYHKNFEEWSALKSRLNERGTPTFKEREVWWCSVGVNVGYVAVGQLRFFDVKRLNEFYGKVSKGEFEKIKKAVRAALLL